MSAKETKKYQLITIFKTKTLPKKAEEVVDGLIKEVSGKVEKVEHLEETKFAYPVKKEEAGVYVSFWIDLPPERLSDLREGLGLQKGIIRTMLVRRTD